MTAAMWLTTMWLAAGRFTAKRFSAALRSVAREVVIGGPWRTIGSLLARRRLFRPALGHGHERRPQAAVTDHITCLHHIDHGAFRNVRVLHFVHRLVAVGIETLADGIDAGDAVTLENVEQLTLGELHAV